ncbi:MULTISPECIES: serine hydrolase [Trichocoleus]|uniref:Serine hydrolase n=1 Tax=Trichocoleus desertorum GB2-A4 TaxID=2933944 RepID=A0ABV0JG30_9CYAN|nr:serine hydrolase [Trichocoleus sp. FACHB-46]MBD1865218.1 serine hydrolase [Trichocoleus sp. FACHB-46]
MTTAQTILSDHEILAILQQRIHQEKQNVGIVVGVIDESGNRIVAQGKRDQTNSYPVDGNTLFKIGSITKVFTTLVLANLVEQGALDLGDRISTLLPDAVKAPTRKGQEISLLHLATHTSGLPCLPGNFAPADMSNPYVDYSVEQLYAFLSSYQLPRDIGSQYEYSNLGTGLLGHLLCLKTGMNYETLIKTQITQPLQMHDTGIQLTVEQQARFATGHNTLAQPVPYWDLPTLAGALRSTANDLLKFLAANLQLVSSSLNAIFQKTHGVQAQTGIPGMAIALGWHVLNHHETEIIFHDGDTGGFRSFLGFVKQKRFGVVVLSNSENDVNDIGLHLLEPRYPLAEHHPPKKRQAIPVDPNLFDAYVGCYELAPDFILAVTKEHDRLYAQATGQSQVELFAETETQFFITEVDAQITFIRDPQGPVEHLILHQAGQEITAPKLNRDTEL